MVTKAIIIELVTEFAKELKNKNLHLRKVILFGSYARNEQHQYSDIDVAALRRYRQRPGMENLLARQRFEAYSESYATHQFYPANNLEGVAPERNHFVNTQRTTIARLIESGVLRND